MIPNVGGQPAAVAAVVEIAYLTETADRGIEAVVEAAADLETGGPEIVGHHRLIPAAASPTRAPLLAEVPLHGVVLLHDIYNVLMSLPQWVLSFKLE